MSEYQPRHSTPVDGRPRRQDAGWFVAYQVRASSRDLAVVQARIQAKLGKLQVVDVVQVVEQPPDDPHVPANATRQQRLLARLAPWVVELQVQQPKSGELGL